MGGKTISVQTLAVFVGKKKINSINDAVVHTMDYRVIDIKAEINGKKKRFSGDGIIVSSAIGSSSYAYSAGGKRLKPTDRKLEIVAIAPYRRLFTPVMIDTGTVSISCERETALIIDGIFIKKLSKGEKIKIKKDRLLTFYDGVGFYD